MIRSLAFFLTMMILSASSAFAQFVRCPSGLANYTPLYSPGANESCGLASGLPSCARKGWRVNPLTLTCTSPQGSTEFAICEGGEILGSIGVLPRCIKPYQEIQNGQPIPSVFNECIQNRWYEGHFSSPVALCSTAIQRTYGSEDIEKIRECVLSGRFSGIPANPQSYCQMRANEFWSKPENMIQQSVWVPR